MVTDDRDVTDATEVKGAKNCGRELFCRHPENPILSAANWPYQINSVFNPGVAMIGDETLLLVRVEDRSGISHLGAARSLDGVTGWNVESSPILVPDVENYPEELWGIEDPRVTRLDELDMWAVTYTAYSRGGPAVCLATTEDFHEFERLGPVMPPENKDAALFPERINGDWMMIHRPVSTFPGGINIWVSSSPDLKHWGNHRLLMPARKGAWWDSGKIGLGPQPLKTPDGWLVLYHGVRQIPGGCLYRLGLAMLDIDEPWRVLRRSEGWVMGPSASYEMTGDVGGVIFPCGWIHDDSTGDIRLYYGAADSRVCMATASMKEILDYVKNCPVP
jgi:beta-1,4-mannooligosaccharide/beta-1,4-mannosyl-N-acetylglucosamine phosphorylase